MDCSLYNAMLFSTNPRRWNQQQVYAPDGCTNITSDTTALDRWVREAEIFTPDQVPASFPPYIHDFHQFAIPSSRWNTSPGGESPIQESGLDNGTSSCKESKSKTNAMTSLVCKEENCKSPGPFSNRGSLKRHIKSQHIAPGAFKCHHHACPKIFNRRDNLNQHLRAVHWDRI